MEELGEYPAFSKLFHWLTAALVIALIGLGLYMTGAPLTLAGKFLLYQLHKSLGVTVLLLTLMRIPARLIWRAPPMPASMPAWERGAAGSAHAMLYALLLAMALSGWAIVSVAAFPPQTVLFGTIPWPHIPFLASLTPQDKKTLEPLFKETHELLGWTLTAILTLHIAAGLRHWLLLKDGVMSRMLPRVFRSIAVIVCAGGFLVLAGTAHAFEWEVDVKKSGIGFETSAGGEPVKGWFGRFKADVNFDEEAPAEAEFTVRVQTGSAMTGNNDGDSALKSPEFFAIQRFPEAVFHAKGARKIGPHAYITTGDLTIKGVTKQVAFPFTLTVENGSGVAAGSFTIDRSEFGVGPEELAGGMTLDKPVKISVSLAVLRIDN
jgi:cytochrome b561/polyisoprenoid-binding protein YceI